jgi:Sulfate permease family
MRLNIVGGLRPLRPSDAGRDALAGVTLASMNIPQVLGYTRIAGTPVVTGLYTVLLPLVVFAVFGSSRHLVVAADSATAAIFSSSLSHMATPASEKYMVLVGMVALLTAGFLLVARFFKLGFLADFLSRTRSPPSWAALLHVVSFDRAGVEVSTRRKARWVSGLDKTTARDHDPAAATPFDRFHRAGTGDDRSRRDLDRATWTLDESDPVVNITNHPVRD